MVHAHIRSSPPHGSQRWAPLIAPGGRVLDVASGSGRHARWLAARGHRVDAVDRDAAALAALPASPASPRIARTSRAGRGRVARRVTRASSSPTTCTGRFSAICSPRWRPGGVLIYETFAAGNERYGRPSNPAVPAAPGRAARGRARAAARRRLRRPARSTSRNRRWCSAFARSPVESAPCRVTR